MNFATQRKRVKLYHYSIIGFLLLCANPPPKLFIFYDVENLMKKSFEQTWLFGPDEYGSNGCPPNCGCPETEVDCPRWYSVENVKQSAMVSDPSVLELHRSELDLARRRAKSYCDIDDGVVGSTGGWCLTPQPRKKKRFVEFSNGVSYKLAQSHTLPSKRLVQELVNLFSEENVTTVNDFGAGIAQYKAAITRFLPHIQYRAFDGAGNGEEYTKRMMAFIDLSIPLDLPVAEWLISLEVGEHIPSKFEGMFVRNLYRHTKKGIVLSWAVLGQGGLSHVNNHSNEYVIQLFEALGFKYDQIRTHKMRLPTDNHPWFQKSIFIFRKIET